MLVQNDLEIKRIKERKKLNNKTDEGPYDIPWTGGVKCELLKCHVFSCADSLDVYCSTALASSLTLILFLGGEEI